MSTMLLLAYVENLSTKGEGCQKSCKRSLWMALYICIEFKPSGNIVEVNIPTRIRIFHYRWFQWSKNKSSRVLNYTFSAGSTKVRFEPQAAIKRF